MSTDIKKVKRKAISLLTTVYQTESKEQVEELEIKVRELLEIISDTTGSDTKVVDRNISVKESARRFLYSHIPTAGGTPPASSSTNDRTTTRSTSSSSASPAFANENGFHTLHTTEVVSKIGEISKPLKQFSERPDLDCPDQYTFLEDAMMKQSLRKWTWSGIVDVTKMDRKCKDKRRNRNPLNKFVISIGGEHEDDLSSVGTECTDISDSERVGDLLHVKTFVEQNDMPSNRQQLALEEAMVNSSSGRWWNLLSY